jgi:hypothetical protein
MNSAPFEISDGDRSRLRAVVATIDRELSCLSLEGTAEDHREAQRGLAVSWAQLVELLEVGPAPEVRECPTCRHVCMRAATLCGHCWTTLGSLPPGAASSSSAV